jgi:hypothetical protein
MVMRRRVDKVGCCGYSARTRAFKQVAATLCKQQVMGFHRRCADTIMLCKAFSAGFAASVCETSDGERALLARRLWTLARKPFFRQVAWFNTAVV